MPVYMQIWLTMVVILGAALFLSQNQKTESGTNVGNKNEISQNNKTTAFVAKTEGLGVSRGEVVAFFGKLTIPEIATTFKEEQILRDGTPRVLGTTNNGVIIELIGPKENLSEASISIPLLGRQQATVHGLMAVGFLQVLFNAKDWPDPINWLTEAAKSQKADVITMRNGHRVHYKLYEELGIISVSVK